MQTVHLPTATKLALLQQSRMEKSEFIKETTAQQKLESLKQALKTSFAEPPEVQRLCLTSEFSTMKKRATESIVCFAYRLKNNLHRLSKLGEAVESNSPPFIMSQFISKTKADIPKHLVLKEYKDLSEIIKAAKRIEEVTVTPTNHRLTHLTLSIPPQPPLSHMGAPRNLFVTTVILLVTSKATALNEQWKHLPLAILNVAMLRMCAACGRNISSHRAPCKISLANMAEHISAPFAPSQDLGHSFTIIFPHLLLIYVIFKHHRVPTLSPAALLHHLSWCAFPANPTSVFDPYSSNIFQRIICQFESYYFVLSSHIRWQQLQLQLDSCSSVTLCSLDHAQLIHPERPELNYKKLDKPIPVEMANNSASLTAVAVQEVPIYVTSQQGNNPCCSCSSKHVFATSMRRESPRCHSSPVRSQWQNSHLPSSSYELYCSV